jgi:hypothetical protein
MTTVGTV